VEYYTHRSGRTARAGRSGISVVLIDPRERRKITRLENDLGLAFDQIR
jgi:ATP-dependent RNA helicase DeaD